ncbi:hypothetical protein [Actinomadura sediminis]|uniref:PASTA domain-containing protein n=1 Tax=Actinomadura sediminis TaxID=1038904 RepID=A0ABW3ETS5_9ACTN
MRLTVKSHSLDALTAPLPPEGEDAIKQFVRHGASTLVARESDRRADPSAKEAHTEQRAQGLVDYVNALIRDETTEEAHEFATWQDLAAAARRLMSVSIFNAVLPAEREVLKSWRASALEGGEAHSKMQRELSTTWANCGTVALNAVKRLRANYGATISPIKETKCEKSWTAEIEDALKLKPSDQNEIYILDCTLGGIHNWLVEAHHDGKRYLIQGYQGAYSAPWWVTDALVDPADLDADLSLVEEPRKKYGVQSDIAAHYDKFIKNLSQIVTDGFNAQSRSGAPVFRELPFDPADKKPAATSGFPILQVQQYTLRNPQAVRMTMPGVSGPLCAQAVLSLPLAVRPLEGQELDEVKQTFAKLGLGCDYRFAADDHEIRVPRGDKNAALRGKRVLRIGLHAPETVRPSDLPAPGEEVEIGTLRAGVEDTIKIAVP